MKIGYVRVSTAGQNTARQEVIMKELDVDKVYIDKLSGKDMNRPALNEMLAYVRDGDSVVVESISRLARNTKDLLEIVEILKNKNVGLVSKKEAIDTETPAGRFMLQVLGAIAEMEREYIKERQREGIEIAKANGIYKGRKPKKLKDFDDVANQYLRGKITGTQAAKILGISRSTWCSRIKPVKDEWLRAMEGHPTLLPY